MSKSQTEKKEYLDPIIVTGCARSGTSLVAGILDRCGAFGGKTCGPTRANRRGQYENRAIIERVQKPYLSSIGADPMGQDPLPGYDELQPDPGRRGRVLDIMIEQGLQPGQPWYFKDAKATLDWPVWQDAFPDAVWVIVRRTRAAIVRSCDRTTFMRRRVNWGPWVDYHLERFADVERTRAAHEVWSERVARGELDDLQAVVEALGLTWDPEAVAAFVDPSLYTMENS